MILQAVRRDASGSDVPETVDRAVPTKQLRHTVESVEVRHQWDDDDGAKYLRISTPIGPYTGMDGVRCLRFNWEQRTGYLAVSDLAGSPYLHLCENRPYTELSDAEIDRVIAELGTLGDRMEQAISSGGDTF